MLLKPPLNKNRVFGTFLWSKCPEKIWLFPNIYDNASHTLSGSQNGLKTGFYSIFVVGGPKIRIRKCGFLAFLWPKWTQLVSPPNWCQFQRPFMVGLNILWWSPCNVLINAHGKHQHQISIIRYCSYKISIHTLCILSSLPKNIVLHHKNVMGS